MFGLTTSIECGKVYHLTVKNTRSTCHSSELFSLPFFALFNPDSVGAVCNRAGSLPTNFTAAQRQYI